jgi:predicted transcriptional regulator
MEKYVVRLITLDKMNQRKATGTPKELAQKLNISESTVYRLVKILRNDMGLSVEYCNKNKCYEYKPNSEKFNFERFAMVTDD